MHSRTPESDLLGRIGRRYARFDKGQRRRDLVRVDRPTPRHFALHARGGDAVLGALDNQASLEMRDCAENVEDEFARCRRRVDLLLKAE